MRFFSRRNDVRLEAGVVVKRSQDPLALEREAAALVELRQAGLAVPKLLGKNEHALFLEYIPGPVYADLVDFLDWPQALELARWLAEHHRLTGQLKGDLNLRNFLWTGKRCVGLDFEDPPLPGELAVDFGRAAAFAATYYPALSEEKARCVQLLLGAFFHLGAEAEQIRAGYLQEVAAMHRRRRRPVGLGEAAAFFDSCLERVRLEQRGGAFDARSSP
ncbi:MAG: RIO1 family regulatory kinase/ATPase [Limnochordia bacterium]|jgi:tRNA A-37 threonylcarbamoyl transferase component Bud32